MEFVSCYGRSVCCWLYSNQHRSADGALQVLCTNAMVNGLLNVYPQNIALSHAPGVVEMSSRVPDGTAAGQNLSAAEELGMSVNYGMMKVWFSTLQCSCSNRHCPVFML